MLRVFFVFNNYLNLLLIHLSLTRMGINGAILLKSGSRLQKNPPCPPLQKGGEKLSDFTN